MTPKEKADELVNRFAKLPEEGTLMWYLSFEIAKKCAIIAVDEILSELAYTQNYVEDAMNKIQVYISYWQEVKQEIEAL